jgi:hypothetical protein
MGIGYEEAGTTKMRLIRLWWGDKKPSFAKKPKALSPEAEALEAMLREDCIQRAGIG